MHSQPTKCQAIGCETTPGRNLKRCSSHYRQGNCAIVWCRSERATDERTVCKEHYREFEASPLAWPRWTASLTPPPPVSPTSEECEAPQCDETSLVGGRYCRDHLHEGKCCVRGCIAPVKQVSTFKGTCAACDHHVKEFDS